jgi:hypothetical protein
VTVAPTARTSSEALALYLAAGVHGRFDELIGYYAIDFAGVRRATDGTLTVLNRGQLVDALRAIQSNGQNMAPVTDVRILGEGAGGVIWFERRKPDGPWFYEFRFVLGDGPPRLARELAIALTPLTGD